MAAVQIARALNATVIAVVNSPEKAAIARKNGATHVIDTTVLDLRSTFNAEVADITQGHGADVVLDQVGGALFHACLSAIARFGRLVVVGFASGDLPKFKGDAIMEKSVSVLGLQVSDYRDREPEKLRLAWQHLVGWFIEGKINPQVMSTYPLQNAAAALNAVKQGLVLGKVVLTIR